MAIAFDAQGGGSFTGSTTPYTFSHTCSGSDRALFVAVMTSTNGSCSGVTYNGVAMTEIGRISDADSGNYTTYLFMLLNPATGANNVVASKSSGTNLFATSASYNGVNQSSQPDNFNTNSAIPGTSLATSVTTVADNCWLIGVVSVGSSPGTVTAGANTTLRYTPGTFTYAGMMDSNAAKTPAGSYALNVDTSVSQVIQAVVASLAPAVASTTPASTLLLMGV